MAHLEIFTGRCQHDFVSLEEPPLGCQSDVQHGVGAEEAGEPGDQVPDVRGGGEVGGAGTGERGQEARRPGGQEADTQHTQHTAPHHHYLSL